MDDDILDAQRRAQQRHVEPVPDDLFNRDESGNGSGAMNGFYVTYINDGGRTEGRTYACTRASGEKSDTCTPFIASALSPGTNWHFGALQYDGSALRYALEAAPFSNGVTHRLGKNPGTYPFQLSHIVSPADKSGVIGNEDEVWWTAAVLTHQQICRIRSVGVQGGLGWCAPDGTHWMACDSDADAAGPVARARATWHCAAGAGDRHCMPDVARCGHARLQPLW